MGYYRGFQIGDTLIHLGKLYSWVIQSCVNFPFQETATNTMKRMLTVVRKLCFGGNCEKLDSDLDGGYDLEL